jgi:hypothetical protein
MRWLRTDQTAQVIIAGHALMQNLRRGHYELAVYAPPATRVSAAFIELARAIWPSDPARVQRVRRFHNATVPNLRPGHYELALDASPAWRVAAAFTELARTI